MILTTQNLLHYLLERGVIEPAAAVDGDVRIVEVSRRHRNFKVMRRDGPGFFVKQVQSWDPHTIFTLQREGTCSWLAENESAFAPLGELVAPFRDYDPTSQVLIVGLFPEAESLVAYHQRCGTFPPDLGSELGRILGEVHREIRIAPGDDPASAMFPGVVPPILSLHLAPHSAWQDHGPAVAHVIHLIRQEPILSRSLSELVRGWQKRSLIHGDVKWDNCVLVPSNGRPDEANRELKLVDWELADVGDPGWDAGAVFHAYLVFWIWSLPVVEAATTQQLVEQAQFPLEQMQPAMQAFWESYCKARDFPPAQTRGQLRLCLRYSAGRMIQTAFEVALASRQVSAQMLLLIQMSQNILTRTDDAIRDLLGM